jgi:pimeloyl-ACP methyl ester carboxylesterase
MLRVRTSNIQITDWLILASLLLSLLAACGQTTPNKNAMDHEQIIFEACHLSIPGLDVRLPAKCGKWSVYENRQAQSGRTIDLNIAILPAISRNPEPDPLFFIAGGPGEAATQSFLVVYAAFQNLNRKRDIVLVDQRGTGGSNPSPCNSINSDDPADDLSDEEFITACLEQWDADPRFYTTSIAMDDLDEVRQVMRYEQINIYGASYGTRAALVYARQHPDHIRTLLLDGIVPPNWTLGPTTSSDAQRALDLIFERCAFETACNQVFPNINLEFSNLMKRVEAAPQPVSLPDPSSGEFITITLTSSVLASMVHTLSYAPETAALLPLYIQNAFQYNDWQPIAAQYLNTMWLLNETVSAGMRLSILCNEDVPFFPDLAPSTSYLNEGLLEALPQLCTNWPRGSIPLDFKQPVTSSVPTLLLSGEADPVTPPVNAQLAAQTLSNSLQLVAPGQGHIVVFRGCISQLATQFINEASVENLDESCVNELQPMPFFINFNGPTP